MNTKEKTNGSKTTNERNQMKTETQRGKFPCDECDRVFKSPAALRMHKVRVHGPGWDTSGNFHRGGVKGVIKRTHHKTREEVLAQKRDYNAKLRALYIAKGLTSAGKVRKRGLRAKNNSIPPPKNEEERLERRREYQRKLRIRYRREGKNSRGYPLRSGLSWTPERRAKFMSTWRSKNAERLASGKPKKKKIQYVYPLPQGIPSTEEVRARLKAEQQEEKPEPLTLDSVRSEIINKIVDTYIDRYLR
jgi:hypothetical protein